MQLKVMGTDGFNSNKTGADGGAASPVTFYSNVGSDGILTPDKPRKLLKDHLQTI